MVRTVYIISLKFAPGLMKEFAVIGENLRKYGLDVQYVISQKYSKLGYFYDGTNYVSTKNGIAGMMTDILRMSLIKEIKNIILEKPPLLVLFYNPHPLNLLLACFIKTKFPNTILSLYLHDPFKPDKSYYGLKKSMCMRVVELLQGLTIRYMDYVISPSEYSSRLFMRKYSLFKGQNRIAPLLVPDNKVSLGQERKFFSIVGNAHNATGHDTFIELVNYVAENGLSYKFCIISSSKIEGFLSKLTKRGREILTIINRPIIKDSEIYKVVSQSLAVLRLDREVTQSGVVPVCYMNATPVIARDIPGLSQHVWHKETGYLIPANPDPQIIVQAMEYVKENFNDLSAKARKAYEDIWAEWNFEKYYGWMIRGLKG